ncbi:penicillin-binding protein [Sporomusa acidovorans]|uniref:Stage V sporulation protein D n=1 Tax=Sporomusa acidovorans (strain ATCC 49682 / DSM 3132 / Mol) TaxID=1123286 RepID=A0ABZ3IWC4_SPOA4|nr:penicillin-binding transpeptidase domain-containing protein [Sporomusa acidovorans]OZC15250.1 stage V sporulation protein D [Sporomusa acidovorans DSM 3132]SDE91195.1 stage V sporulation protein D (sporulation-specific penicillin-binding protein) [Sporomusa acidovorans]
MAMPVNMQKRLAWFLTVIMLGLFTLAVRVAWIQFGEGKRLSAKVQDQLQESRVMQSPRGTIYDRNGRELAVSSLNKSLYADPQEVKDADELAGLLAPVLAMPAADLKERLTAEARFVWLKRTLEPEAAKAVSALIKEHQLTGLGFIEESKRYYPNDSLAAQVLGFVGTDDVGLEGIENSLDKVIKGSKRKQVIDTDSYGTPIFQSVFSFLPEKKGRSVCLTIDSNIQYIVERALDAAMAKTGARAGTVVIIQPKTGEILAMASRPTYNPNQFENYGAEALKNRAISIIYEPGSTFKSVIAAAALEEGKVRPDERFIDKGYVEVSGRKIKNWSDESYGSITFTDIIKNSINTGFVQVGLRVGAAKLTNYARAFGFGKATGIELPGEEEGLLFDPKDMRDSDTATMSIGQSIAVTPLQLTTAIAAIANDGVLLKPRILKEYRNEDGTVEETFEPVIVRQVISPETARTLKGLLEKVVSEGGGKLAAVKGYRFAGKTGTAEKLNPNGVGYLAGHYIASFAGFGPVDDPQVAAVVMLDDPLTGMYYGGTIAAPVFSDIMSQVMRVMGIRPEDGSRLLPPAKPEAATTNQAALPAGQGTIPAVPAGQVLIPPLTGKTMREAGDMLHGLGLTFVPVGTGIAVKQSPAPYTTAKPGTEIIVYFESVNTIP